MKKIIILYGCMILMVYLARPFSVLEAQCDQAINNPYKVDYSAPRTIPGMKLVWHDEFEKEGRPDSANWTYEHGFVRNKELQWYQPENAYCRDGRLIIEGRREKIKNPAYNPEGKDWRTMRQYADYTSSCVITRGLQEWGSYGYFEIRARIDTAMGAWPAIWLLGTNDHWPAGGEIDMLEFYRINGIPAILANVAWGTDQKYIAAWSSERIPLQKFTTFGHDWVKKYHIWSMKWDEHSIQLMIDGKLVNETPISCTVNPDGSNPFLAGNTHYILLNLALGANGGNPVHSKFPVTFEIDYVRVYKTDKQ